jgi:hypothetical protein
MAKKGGSGLDKRTQQYVDYTRQMAKQSAGLVNQVGPQTMSVADQTAQFMNPYIQNVVNATGSQFDQLRAQGVMQGNQAATLAGAFGGSRHGVAQGVRMGELDQAQMAQMANLYASGHQNAVQQAIPYFQHQQMLPLQVQQARMGILNGAMGPTGPAQQKGSAIGSAIGGAQVGSAFGPWGAAIGGGIGLLGGLL